MSSAETIRETTVAGRSVRRGKVRDIYDLGDRLLIVATDRISAFDCVLPDPIPHKGRILTALSKFWFEMLEAECPNHLIEVVEDRPPEGFESLAGALRGRAMVCRKAQVIPIECVARGYLAGSCWAEYQERGTACGIHLPAGLRNCEMLEKPIFTPATKAEHGHDENISFREMETRVGPELARRLRELTLSLYAKAAAYALERGVIIADTKFEFGVTDEGILLIDEALTPDSSRFWPADRYRPGANPESFDKQFVRDYLQRLCDEGRWDKKPPSPSLPRDVIEATSRRYIEAYERITGRPFAT